MLFNTLTFLIFLLVVVVAYWLLPHGIRWVFLLVASYVFYASWNPAYLLLLFGSSLVTYAFCLGIERHRRYARVWLVLVICACFGALIYFKYADLFGQSANGLAALFDLQLDIPLFNILLPVGISFQMFQNVGYAVDIYRGKVAAEPNFFRYALFQGYFPQLVAGPIERAANLLPQLRAPHVFEYSEVTLGLRFMLVGFFKKIVVADTVAVYVNTVYNNVGDYTGLALILASVLFAFQIYCDFSGYSDIAVGVSKLFGIDLTINFKSPYFSRNIQEFWRRWHISLSTWFQDYVYIPLGGSRVKVPHYIINLLITFTISGLWHGASWTFLLWGALHGLLVASYVLFGRLRTWMRTRRAERGGGATGDGSSPPRPRPALTVLSVLTNFLIVDILWVFFRANSFSDALYVLGNAFTGIQFSVAYLHDQLASMGFTVPALIAVLFALVLLVGLDAVNYRETAAVVLGRQKTVVRWAVYLLGSAIIIGAFMFTSESQNFIYFQF